MYQKKRLRPAVKKLLLILFLIFGFLTGNSIAQTGNPTVYINNITGPAIGQDVTVPLNFKNLSNVGAVSIKIIFDTSVLDFVNITDNPSHGTFLTNSNFAALGGVHDTLAITWFDTSPVNYTDGAFVNLHFTYKGGNGSFHFLPSPVTSLADVNGLPISNLVLTDGSITAPAAPTGSIGDYVWIDADGNGIQSSGELPLGNVTVKLLDPANNNSVLQTTTTNASGIYSFSGLNSGTYKVQFTAPAGYVLSRQHTGGNLSLLGDSDPDSLTGITDTVQLVQGYMNRYDIDAGMHVPFPAVDPTGSIGDYVWNDANKNGLQDTGELPVAGVQVKLLNADNNDAVINTTSTNASGVYEFYNVTAGNYKVQFVPPANYLISPKDVNNNQSDAGDSDPDTATGKTDLIVLTAGENTYSVDAGMYQSSSQPQLGSMGDWVFNDANHNGLQDSGEVGVSGVTVKLLDTNLNVLQTTTTDNNGNYIFTNLASGNYRLKFDAPQGYVFCPADVSEANNGAYDSEADSTGLTKVLWLNDGENNMTYDAGMYKTAPTVQSPVLFVGLDDGITTAPDSGLTTVYTISYRNDGNGDLLNGSVTDTLPEGMSFVKSSSNVSATVSGNIVTVQLGTVSANSSGSFTLEAMTTALESEYLNQVLFSGVDAGNKSYSESAQDLNFGASPSNGDGAGLESRGDLAEALLRRQLRIQTGTKIPVIAKTSTSGISAAQTLDQLIPSVGPYSSTATVSTPYDILGVSNAVSSYAVNYDLSTSGTAHRVAGVFATVTPAPDIYDHTKAICDRLEGAEIKEIKLLDINGYKFYAAKMLKHDENIVDYAISFSVYETAGAEYVQSKWTHDEYQAPNGATSVYNFQVWSGSYDNSVQLAKQILAKISAIRPLSYMNTSQFSPDTYISQVRYTHDGKIHMTVINNDAQKSVGFTTMYRVAQGNSQASRTDNINLIAGTNDVVINTGIIADANVYMNQVNAFCDEAFVSGGAYTYVTGSSTTVSSFNTANFPQVDISSYPANALVLSGGAGLSGSLKDYVNVVRSLNSNGKAYDLSKYSSIRFEAHGSGKLEVLLVMTNTQNSNYYHYTVNLNSTDKEYMLNFSDFTELYGSQTPFDASKICDVAFSMNVDENQGMDTFSFEVKNIAFYTPGSITAVDNATNVPNEFSLSQNYPNPFNPSTTIQFSVAKQEHITLIVYNLLGQEVKRLVDSDLSAGKHSVTFNADYLASGIYFYKLVGNSVNITKKMILMK